MANIRTIHTYVDAVKARHSLQFDHQAAALIGVASSVVSGWKAGRTHVSDEHAVKMAELGGLDPHLAVIDAAIWRAEGKPHYKILVETAAIIQSAA